MAHASSGRKAGSSYYERRAKTEQMEAMREAVKKAVEDMGKWAAHVDAAFAKARLSLEALRKALAKVRV